MRLAQVGERRKRLVSVGLSLVVVVGPPRLGSMALSGFLLEMGGKRERRERRGGRMDGDYYTLQYTTIILLTHSPLSPPTVLGTQLVRG